MVRESISTILRHSLRLRLLLLAVTLLLAAALTGPLPASATAQPVFDTAWGSFGTGNGQFEEPYALAVDPAGNVFVADASRIQKFTANGEYLTGWNIGTSYGMDLSPDGAFVYVLRPGGSTTYCPPQGGPCSPAIAYSLVARYTSEGTFVDEQRFSYGPYSFPSHPTAIATRIVVIGQPGGEPLVQVAVSMAVPPDHSIITYRYDDQGFGFYQRLEGFNPGQPFQAPRNLAYGLDNSIYVLDAGTRVLSPGSTWGDAGSGPGEFNDAYGIAVGPDGTVYVADTGNHRVQAFDGTGSLQMLWGQAGSAAGQFQSPRDVAIAASGAIYVADTGNHRIQKFIRDTTPPTDIVFVGGPAADTSYYFGDLPAAPTCTATDTGSGLASCAVTGYSSEVGTHTLVATATDNAGNSAAASRTYTVLPWSLRGFYAPVNMDGMNVVKGGSTVPLKFEVFKGADELTDPAVVQQLDAIPIACADGSLAGDIDVISTDAHGLRYDGASGMFHLNWKLPRVSGCFELRLTTQDGSLLSTPFTLR